MATISWTLTATVGLEEEMTWIAQRNRFAAQRISQQLVEAVNRLDHFPNRGRRGRIPHTRELVVRDYVITYQVRGPDVIVLRVVHGRRLR